MRRAFLRLQRRPTNSHCLNLSYHPSSACLPRTALPRGNYFRSRNLRISSRFFRADFCTVAHVPFAGEQSEHELLLKDGDQRIHEGGLPRPPAKKLKDPSAWVELLQPYLPFRLRSPKQQNSATEHACQTEDKRATCESILLLLDLARQRQHAGVELLAYMAISGQKDAAIYMMRLLLDNLAIRNVSRAKSELPSNISWPAEALKDLCKKPIQPLSVTKSSSGPLMDSRGAIDPRYSSVLSEHKETTMTQIWPTLASLVIQSADLKDGEAETAMNVVLLVLGHIHNLDLIPENVYSYRSSPFSTNVRKPPILHFLSSRMLTALSDATWREQQDEMIRKAASHGVSYEDIGRDPPGGRFRLKVRPLGAEVWLEFILWCCVEGGFGNVGGRIIRQLHAQVENPWYAITWSPSSGRSHVNPTVDWDRVKARYGASVGLREGYSGERPLIEMPARTISTEVVLGLVEASINTVKSGAVFGTSVQIVQRNIVSLIKFLEPHDLPPSYFNYLAVRLVQAEAFDLPYYASSLYAWYDNLHSLKSLQSTKVQRTSNVAFDIETLSTHSELFAGLLHQSIDGFVQIGDIHRALKAFNDLQELVDISKLQAIGSFLNQNTKPTTGEFFFSQPYKHRAQLQDFVGSHGQIPAYKLPGILDLATDTGLTGFVRWLLYNSDPDGPLIPRSAYRSPGVAGALLRFASLSRDENLISRVLSVQKTTNRLPTVRFLRALLNTDIAALNHRNWHGVLSQLANIRGGGVGLSNIAQLAVTVLKLEIGGIHAEDSTLQGRALDQARRILASILRGKYRERNGTFSQKVRREYKQQLGALLHVFRSYPESSLSSLAAQHANRFPPTNLPRLSPSLFNMFVETTTDCKGAGEGVRLWDNFCEKSFPDDATTKRDSVSEELIDFDAFDSGFQEQRYITPHSGANQVQSHSPDATLDNSDHEAREQIRQMASHGFFPATHRQDPEPTGVQGDSLVIPNQRTLRLIIRSAVQERREILAHQGKPKQQDEILRWAASQLEKFGVSKRMISMELEGSPVQAAFRELEPRQITPTPFDKVSASVVRKIESQFGVKAR